MTVLQVCIILHFSLSYSSNNIGFETGFPPPDRAVRDYLAKPSQSGAAAVSFLISLFEQTAIEVTKLKKQERIINTPKRVASHFRELMTKGQVFNKCNEFRQTFYDQVIARATAVSLSLTR